MAEVFRARREGAAGFERTVVVKKILASYHEDPEFVGMFINEAKIAACLTHPNIVQVYELGEQDGELFMAMEYVQGQDLLRVLRLSARATPDAPALPPLVSAYIARETCRALAHAHGHRDETGAERPIVHRDISPQNIMLSIEGQVKLVDFGVAKALASATEDTCTGALKGKIAYMSPEQLAGKSPGPQSDIFSTGIVLYEMLTGKRLFKGDSDYDTLRKVQSLPLMPPSTLNPAVPPQLDNIVMYALTRDKEQRYPRACQMARDLDTYLQTHGFAVEDMVEYVRSLFPSGSVDTLSDPQERSPSHVIVDTVAMRRMRQAWAQALPPRRRRAIYAVAGGLAILLAATLVPAVRERASSPMVLEPLVISPALRPTQPAPLPEGEARTKTARVVVSVPSSLLGTPPLTLQRFKGTLLPLTLVRPRYEDFNHALQVDDSPRVTARSHRRRESGSRRVVIAPSAREGGARRLRVESVDEGASSLVPRVQVIED